MFLYHSCFFSNRLKLCALLSLYLTCQDAWVQQSHAAKIPLTSLEVELPGHQPVATGGIRGQCYPKYFCCIQIVLCPEKIVLNI